MKGVSPQTLKWLWLIFFLTTLGGILYLFKPMDFFRPEAIREVIYSAGPWAPAAYLLIYAIAPTLFFPGWVLTVAGGLAFGAFWGTVLTVIGATIGATVAFFVARWLGRDVVSRWLPDRFKVLDDRAARHGFQVIFFLRLIPLVPFDVLDYLAGVSKIGPRHFVAGTMLGIIPGTFAYVYLGSSLAEEFSWKIGLALTLLVVLALIPPTYRRWKGGRIFPET